MMGSKVTLEINPEKCRHEIQDVITSKMANEVSLNV
jgi:hypothetical protein